jgi:hypothetical protein
VKSGTIETTIPATAEPTPIDPELGKHRCPNGHDSAAPPDYPAVMFVACGHYSPGIVATWNEFCITCGKRHVPLTIYWRRYSSHGPPTRALNPKHFCGYCGAKMVGGASR